MLPNYTYYVPVESNYILEMREKRHSNKANRHWPRMHSLIYKVQADVAVKLGSNVDIPVLSPIKFGRMRPKTCAGKSFAHELRHKRSISNLDCLSLARLMHSLWNYCKLLMPILTSKNDK